jgi:GNAT superfamily N-acetyltransferase
VKAAAGWHATALPDGFFARLGRRFLRAYWDSYRRSPHALALVALAGDGSVVGVLAGTTDSAAHYRWVVRHRGARLAAVALAALVTRPALAVRFWRTRGRLYARGLLRFLLPRRRRPGGGPAPGTPGATLAHVVVDDPARRSGVGTALVREFEAKARASGVRRLRLLAHDGDTALSAFYRGLGWRQGPIRIDVDGVAWREYTG